MTKTIYRRRRALRIENLESRQLLATVSGVVFNDVNGNRSQEVGDVELPDRTVFLDLDGDSTVDAGEPAMLTDSNGGYSFQIPTVTVSQNFYVGLVLPAPEATGRWQNTNNNYQRFEVDPPAGVNTVLNFGLHFVPYTTFQPIGIETLVGEDAKVTYGHFYGWQNIATDGTGNYATLFVRDAAGGKEQVNLRVYDANGTLRGVEIPVAGIAFGSRQMVTMSRDGTRIAVSWMQTDSNGSQAPFVRLYDSAGAPIGTQIQVAPYGSIRSLKVPLKTLSEGIVMDSQGNFTVLMAVNNGNIQFQRYTRAGAASGRSVVVSSGGFVNYQHGIGMDASGKFVVTWHTVSGIHAQRFSATGSTIGSRILVAPDTTAVNLRYPAVAMNETGRFVITWGADAYTNPKRLAQVFDPIGARIGGQVDITFPGAVEFPNALTMNAAGDVTFPFVRNAAGSFASGGATTEELDKASEIWVRRLSASGLLSEAQIVNSTTQGYQAIPSIASTPSGFIVSWLGPKSGGGQGMFTQQYQLPVTAPASRISANSTSDDSSSVDYLMASSVDDPLEIKARSKSSRASVSR